MPLTPRLVLHAGAPKTGSTYLQKRLRADPERLRAHGVHVPVLPQVARMAGNAKLLATALSPQPSVNFTRAFAHLAADALDPRRIVDDLLAGWDEQRETVILSAENFQPAQAAVLRSLIPARVACTVVLFVRRQDRWIESYHNQLVKSDGMRIDLASFVRFICDADGRRLCHPNWNEHHAAWLSAFGSCEIAFYDEVRGDLFGAFMAAAGLSAPPGYADVEPVQVSLDAHQLAYLLQLERPVPFEAFARRRAASAQASRRLGAPPPRSFLGAADRALLHERFDAPNRRLLRTLGRSPDESPLRMDDVDGDAARLEDVYASSAYAAHRDLADAIYAGETP